MHHGFPYPPIQTKHATKPPSCRVVRPVVTPKSTPPKKRTNLESRFYARNFQPATQALIEQTPDDRRALQYDELVTVTETLFFS